MTKGPPNKDAGKLLFFEPRTHKPPPHDLDAEAALLSASIVEPRSLDIVLEFLKPEHFYSERHRRIFEACRDLQEERLPVDVIQVATRLRSRDRLEQIGGMGYLTSLLDVAPNVHNVEAYGKTIREKWRVRELISACQSVVAQGYEDFGDAQAFIDKAEQAVYAISHIPESSSVRKLNEVLRESFQRLSDAGGGAALGLATRYDRFDRITSGFHDGELSIVAARPGMGKTSFILNLAANVARPLRLENSHDANDRWEVAGAGVVIFSLEMPREQIANRMLCCEARVDVSKIRNGNLMREDWSRLTQSAAELGPLPVWIDDTPAISLLEIRAKVRRLQADFDKKGTDGKVTRRIGLVIIDYLQLMRGRDNAGNREQEISEISRGLKSLAKELSVPVIALSQLNRAVEARTDKRPMISDLRESGAIEQDADNIIFIYRDEYYTKDLCKMPGVVELIVAKQRNGPTATAMLRWSGEYTRFDELPEGEYQEDS